LLQNKPLVINLLSLNRPSLHFLMIRSPLLTGFGVWTLASDDVVPTTSDCGV
jgi:hypothetical protein